MLCARRVGGGAIDRGFLGFVPLVQPGLRRLDSRVEAAHVGFERFGAPWIDGRKLAAALEDPKVQEAIAAVSDPDVIAQAQAAGRRTGKSILDDFANVFAGMAAYYQPRPDGTNTNADEKKFLAYSGMAIIAADKVSQYQTPKLSAVMVGMAQVRTIQVDGGKHMH